MSALAVLDAERIKLSTTRSTLWSVAGAAVVGLGVAVIQALTAYALSPVPPEKAALGVAVFGVPVLMVLASMTVTGEYRSGMIRTTFMATPNRTVVLMAKAVVSATFSGMCAAVMVVAAVIMARLAGSPLVGSQLSLTASGTWRVVGGIALYAVLAAMLGVAVGALLRFAAGAVAVLLLWPLVVEPILGNLPNISTAVGPYLPFANMFRFLGVSWLYPAYDMPWGAFGSLLYLVVVVGVVFIAAIIVLNRRDA